MEARLGRIGRRFSAFPDDLKVELRPLSISGWLKRKSVLENPLDWLLRLVQAATSLSAKELCIRQDTHKVCFEFRGRMDTTPENIVSSLQTDHATPSLLRDLTAALHFLCLHTHTRWMLEFSHHRHLWWDGGALWVFERRIGSPPAICLTVGRPEPRPKRGTFLPDLAKVLAWRCYCCPIVLKLDGRMYNGPLHDLVSGIATDLRVPFALRCLEGEKYLKRFSLLGGPHWFVQKHKVQLPGTSGWAIPNKDRLQADMIGFLTAELSGEPRPSYLLWSYHGVLVKREELPALGCVGVTLLLCGDDLVADSTGLALREGSFYEAQRREALVLAREALLDLAQVAHEIRLLTKSSDSVYAKLWSEINPWREKESHVLIAEGKMVAEGVRRLASDFWRP